MTFEELRKEYEDKAEKFHNEAEKENARAKRYEGYRDLCYEDSPNYKCCSEIVTEAYEKARELYEKSTIYYSVLLDLLKLQTK